MAILTMNFYSKLMSRSVNVNIILPDDMRFNEVQRPYKTLYFLPGYSASCTELCQQIKLMEQSLYKGIAIVVPDGENSFYVDQPELKTFFGKYITEELLEVTRNLFPLSNRREDTFIGGISMGGYGALILGISNADKYSKILAMSPPTEIYELVDINMFTKVFMDRIFGSKEEYSKEYDPASLLHKSKEMKKQIPQLFQCCGRQDELVIDQNTRFVRFLKEKNIPCTYIEDDGGHDIVFWNKYLGAGIDFLLGE